MREDSKMRFAYRLLVLLACALALLSCGALPTIPLVAEQPPAAHTAILSSQSTAPTASQSPAASSLLRVHFIDVGQGDSILIQAPDDATMLIDGGYSGSGALAYLKAHRIAKIDIMVATHPHADHIGGLVDVLRAMPVGAVWTSGALHTTGIFEQFLDAIADAKVPYHEAQRGDTITLSNLQFIVLHSDPHAADLNDSSVVLHLTYGQVSFLFTGDAERPSERAMLGEESALLPSTVLKVGHHGSYTSSSTEFLAVVRPAIAVYSAGAHNSYGHPHASTIHNLERIGATIYGTDKDGTVVVSTDGSTYTVATAHTDTQLPSMPVAATTPPPTTLQPTNTGVLQPAITPTARSSAVPNGANPCKQRVDGSQAPNAPIMIVSVDKVAEVVVIRNTSAADVDLTGWTICSLLGSQLHAHLSGVLAPGETRAVPSQAARAIWNDRSKERAAVYNSAGHVISYWSEAGR
jgi:competence protein ComEC